MIPWFEWKTIHFGFITLQVWGMWVALGILFSLFIIKKRTKEKPVFGTFLLDASLWSVIFGVIFARIFHILFYEPIFYWHNPIEILKIWHGGLSSFGGFLGAALAFWLYAKRKKINKTQLIEAADILSFAALYGWLVGRVGCLFIHDHLGKISHFFLAIRTPDGPRLEMALLEIIGLLPLAIFFFIQRNKKKPAGWFMAVLFLYYGLMRFVLDFFRATDIALSDARYLGLTPGHYFAIVLALLGGFLLRKSLKK